MLGMQGGRPGEAMHCTPLRMPRHAVGSSCACLESSCAPPLQFYVDNFAIPAAAEAKDAGREALDVGEGPRV